MFDFDGLIVDTEMPIFLAAAAAFREHGHEVAAEHWSAIVGLPDSQEGWYPTLVERLGIDLDRALFDQAYARQDRSWRDQQPALPGVIELLDELRAAGIGCGVASGSPVAWLEKHLGRLGLLDRFATLAGVDRVARGKPAPDVYLLACQELGAAPARSVALEDSAHGVEAARAAGLAVVAVPTALTQYTDLTAADRVVPSLSKVTVADLAGLVPPR
ncbi:MAG: haloacid dehalogenase superfamily enzyme subfamily [Acidimicrobiales bacterium]|nr:haloacid dehalogenase superfamily enzyme subfamily [Acidimicrobiales bacterium]